MGSRTPDGEGLGSLVRLLEDLKRRVTTLETPTGTSVRGLVDQVRMALANITTTVTDAISTLSYTKTQIDTRVANPPAGSNVTGNIASTGSVTAAGDVTATGNVTAVNGLGSFPAGLSSLDARNRVVSTGYAGMWIDNTGRIGIQPSSRRFKKHIAVWRTDISRLLELRRVTFRYIVAIDADPDAMLKPKQVGFIAEELCDLGFPEFVFYDSEGQVQGVNYDRLVVALLELAAWEHDRNEVRFTALEQRMTAAGI